MKDLIHGVASNEFKLKGFLALILRGGGSHFLGNQVMHLKTPCGEMARNKYTVGHSSRSAEGLKIISPPKRRSEIQ